MSFGPRGFPITPSPSTERLESIPQSVVCGFEWGIGARDLWELEQRLDLIEPEMRGFAYEGATMALTVRDAMGGQRGHRTQDFLLGPGQPHVLLAYIGIGFAMARLPRPLWKKVIPDLSGSPYYPTMTWLAVDGYGFDLAYFHTRRWVDEQRVPAPYPWQGMPDYFLRVVDQGIGRALWFIHAAHAGDVADAVGRFAEHRRADLWSGVGLAATFAGGSSAENFARLRAEAGAYQPDLGVGTVFAVTARDHADFVPDHTEIATKELIGMSVAEAVDVSRDAENSADPQNGQVPRYESWRRRIRDHFTTD